MRDLDAKESTPRHLDTGADALPLLTRDTAVDDTAPLHRISPSFTDTTATAASCDATANPRPAPRLCAKRTTSGRTSNRHRYRSIVVFGMLLVAILSLVSCSFIVEEEHDDLLFSAAEISAESLAWNASLSVLVLHREPLTCLDKTQQLRREKGLASRTVMRRTQLPSWTLHVVEAACAECLDSATHAAAVARQLGNRSDAAAAAVFATPSAPLGLAGPMLFAMASVTDDVAVGAELARWGWVGRSRAVRRQFAGASPVGLKGGTTPYLVVSGIPSTDQPVRASLRDAQRATWLSYRDVARSENGFDGALLPLYIFAAAERELSQGVTDMSPLLPTVAEYEDASTMVLHDDDDAALSYEVRRVEVIHGLQSMGAHDPRLPESPCATIVTKSYKARADAAPTWVSQLASALQLPVRPAAVAPAEFICHASAALWQEALAHRNVLWVDMMTDRRPTSKKKLGQRGNWGLPVEVGMSQKLVLWLEYAYHAFPDVPYIMKNDDDTYLKVPQFVSDVRYMRAGFQGERAATVVGAPRDPVGIEKTEECIYWGNRMRNPHWHRLRYHAGSGYMLHRRLVQVVLESSDRLNSEAVRLGVTPYQRRYDAVYHALVMNIEDAFVGRMLRDKRQRIRELCPSHGGLFVEEPRSRHFDLHASRLVGWPAVLMHHCTPADEYYLHYFFQHEHEVAASAGQYSAAAEATALRAASAWMAASVSHSTKGYGRYPKVRWTLQRRDKVAYVSAGDNVSVYLVPYLSVKFNALDRTRRAAPQV